MIRLLALLALFACASSVWTQAWFRQYASVQKGGKKGTLYQVWVADTFPLPSGKSNGKGNGKSKGKTKGSIGSSGGHLNDDDEREEQGDTDDDEREDHDEREEQTAASSSEWPKGKCKVDGKDNQQGDTCIAFRKGNVKGYQQGKGKSEMTRERALDILANLPEHRRWEWVLNGAILAINLALDELGVDDDNEGGTP